MRVVLDTNVLISTLLFGGRLQFLVGLLQHGDITPCFSHQTWQELVHTLHYPHLLHILEQHHLHIDEVLTRIKTNALLFHNTQSPVPVPQDHADEAILACAVTAQAGAIVTGDKHLLALASTFAIPIMTPQQFKKSFFSYA